MSSKPIKYSLVFNRKNQLNDKGEALLQIEAYKDGKRYYISTGHHLKPDHWSSEKEKVIKRPDNHSINNRIQEHIRELQDIEANHGRRNTGFNIDDLKKALEKKENSSFIEFSLDYLSKEKNLSGATKTKYLNSINSFGKFAGIDVKFEGLTPEIADDFRLHLVGEGIGPNTQKTYFKHLNKYAKIAVARRYIDALANPFQEIKIKSEKTYRKALSEDELKKIEKITFASTQRHLEIIRDLFLFECYTGLRFSDASRVSQEHIVETNNGLELKMKAEKGKKPIDLPLRLLFPDGKKESRPERLLRKYWREDNKPLFLAAKSLQSKSANNQHTNRELKIIQEKAKIATHLTNHIGRHTFATFLVYRLPLPVVMELLQHSKSETTKIYLHVTNDKVKEQLKKIKDWV